MKIDTSFDSAFLQLQNGVNNAKKAADTVLASVDADKKGKVSVPTVNNSNSGKGAGGVNVSV